MRTRTFFVVALLASLLVAGGVSYYASSHPDGLEYVAEKAGFAHAAEDSATAGSPLSDYQVRGIENDALSGGLAGIAGALIVLVLAGGLTYVVRRRGAGAAEHASAQDPNAQDPNAQDPDAQDPDAESPGAPVDGQAADRSRR